MVSIPDKTLEDLEYDEVLRQCAAFAITPMGKEVVLGLKPQTDAEQVMKKLHPSIAEYAGLVQRNYACYIRSGAFPEVPSLPKHR